MSPLGIALSVIAGLLINELGEWCPWLAHRLVCWSARLRFHDDPVRSAERAEDLEAYINDRPGKLFKLIVATAFVLGAARGRVVRRMDAGMSAGRAALVHLRNPDVRLFAPVVLIYLADTFLIAMTGGLLAALWILGLYAIGALAGRSQTTSKPGPPAPQGVRQVLAAGAGIAVALGLIGGFVALGIAAGRQVVKGMGRPDLSGDLLSDIMTVDIYTLLFGMTVLGSLLISETLVRRLSRRRSRVG